MIKTIYDRAGNARYFRDGEEITKAEYEKALPSKIKEVIAAGTNAGTLSSCWPMVSDGCGVHPRQIQEATERNKRNGVNVTYDSRGCAIIPNRTERKKLLRLEGMHDRSGGYGD